MPGKHARPRRQRAAAYAYAAIAIAAAALAGATSASASSFDGLNLGLPGRSSAQPAKPAPSASELPRTAQQRIVTPAQPAQAPTAGATPPPLHGTNPHAQGTVLSLDLQPKPDRPFAGDPTGTANGEEVVVGRSRADRAEDGSYRGHVTVLALFGNEIVGVSTKQGESRSGPLDPVQKNLLDQVCQQSMGLICLQVAKVDSSSDANGSRNEFALARAKVGVQGAPVLDLGLAESQASLSADRTTGCETAEGSSRLASIGLGGQLSVEGLSSLSRSRSCADGTQEQGNQSTVAKINTPAGDLVQQLDGVLGQLLGAISGGGGGGQQLPIDPGQLNQLCQQASQIPLLGPSLSQGCTQLVQTIQGGSGGGGGSQPNPLTDLLTALLGDVRGCLQGTPNAQAGLPPLLTLTCHANDSNGAQAASPYGVREALAVTLLGGQTQNPFAEVPVLGQIVGQLIGAAPQAGLVRLALAQAESKAAPVAVASAPPSQQQAQQIQSPQSPQSLPTPTPVAEQVPELGERPQAVPAVERRPVRPARARIAGKELPFTGLEVALIAAAGLLTLTGGLALRRLVPAS
ncbi:hypothetical protein [Thermoleophilum album]|uniref:Gram-positive cocci surface proteins LPxTG domain-containing protein n=1 Tax=Thermoleophilum album TaxID=29539 RepID=A0A1H6G1K7_THEAL|nr:hypothetical protein [Thermoleophilum album]SEH15785.1 hypothetical protein SAMN02745716_2064 [Thermoleophilum album]